MQKWDREFFLLLLLLLLLLLISSLVLPLTRLALLPTPQLRELYNIIHKARL
jgi:hypothetical protein